MKLSNFVLFSLAIFALGFVTSCKRPQHASMDSRPLGLVRLHDQATGAFFCSGAVISRDYVVTAAHCLSGRQGIMPGIVVTSSDGKVASIAFAAVGEGRSDQGLLTGDFSGFKPLKAVWDTATIVNSLHDRFIACGYPYGGKLFCTKFVYEHNYNFQIAGPGYLYPGMSGGPVIDTTSGYIIGVNTAVDGGFIVVSPIVEIFSNLGVQRGEAN